MDNFRVITQNVPSWGYFSKTDSLNGNNFLSLAIRFPIKTIKQYRIAKNQITNKQTKIWQTWIVPRNGRETGEMQQALNSNYFDGRPYSIRRKN